MDDPHWLAQMRLADALPPIVGVAMLLASLAWTWDRGLGDPVLALAISGIALVALGWPRRDEGAPDPAAQQAHAWHQLAAELGWERHVTVMPDGRVFYSRRPLDHVPDTADGRIYRDGRDGLAEGLSIPSPMGPVVDEIQRRDPTRLHRINELGNDLKGLDFVGLRGFEVTGQSTDRLHYTFRGAETAAAGHMLVSVAAARAAGSAVRLHAQVRPGEEQNGTVELGVG